MTDSGTFVSRALWWLASWISLTLLLGLDFFSSWYWTAPTEQKFFACAVVFILINVALAFSGLDGGASGAPGMPKSG